MPKASDQERRHGRQGPRHQEGQGAAPVSATGARQCSQAGVTSAIAAKPAARNHVGNPARWLLRRPKPVRQERAASGNDGGAAGHPAGILVQCRDR